MEAYWIFRQPPLGVLLISFVTITYIFYGLTQFER